MLLKACTETGYDRNVAHVMALLRKYVSEFTPLSLEDLKEKQLYVNLLSDCTKHVEATISGIAMYIYKSITGEDSDKRLRFARKHLGHITSPTDDRGRSIAQSGVFARSRQPQRQNLRQFRQPSGMPRDRNVCFRCRKGGHFARDCK